jgi:serine/threonine-protein kinase HSL1, negative regulator of Swe1 kinase
MKLHEAIDTLDKIYLVVEFLDAPSLSRYIKGTALSQGELVLIIK